MKFRRMNKKGILENVAGIFQQLLFIGILGAIFLIINSNLIATIPATTGQNNMSISAIGNVSLSITNTFVQLPLFGTILGLMIILGLVFWMFRGGSTAGAGIV